MSLIAGNHVAKNRRYQTPLSPGLGGWKCVRLRPERNEHTMVYVCVCVCNLLHIFSWRHRPRRRFGSDWMVAQIERHARTHAYCVGRGRLFGEPLCCYIVVWLRRAVCLTCTRSRTPTTTKKNRERWTTKTRAAGAFFCRVFGCRAQSKSACQHARAITRACPRQIARRKTGAAGRPRT